MAEIDFTAAPVFRTSAPKAKMTIYFALLIIALFALMIACGFMYAEIRAHGGFGTVQGRVTSVEQSAPSRMLAFEQVTLICSRPL
jgi:hypothetical protein